MRKKIKNEVCEASGSSICQWEQFASACRDLKEEIRKLMMPMKKRIDRIFGIE